MIGNWFKLVINYQNNWPFENWFVLISDYITISSIIYLRWKFLWNLSKYKYELIDNTILIQLQRYEQIIFLKYIDLLDKSTVKISVFLLLRSIWTGE